VGSTEDSIVFSNAQFKIVDIGELASDILVEASSRLTNVFNEFQNSLWDFVFQVSSILDETIIDGNPVGIEPVLEIRPLTGDMLVGGVSPVTFRDVVQQSGDHISDLIAVGIIQPPDHSVLFQYLDQSIIFWDILNTPISLKKGLEDFFTVAAKGFQGRLGASCLAPAHSGNSI
jgi:hypothetical protein